MIIHHHNDWVVVSKPANLSVHNSPGHDLVTSVSDKLGCSVLPINRLDVGTSGLVLFAKNREAAGVFGKLLAAGKLGKSYLAITRKHPPGKEAAGEWQTPLSRKAGSRKNPRGLQRDRVPCLTRWQVKAEYEGRSLLRIELITGRKHQIRRHAAIHRCPLVGDDRYGNDHDVGRLGLHAHKLQFSYAGTRFAIETQPEKCFWSLLSSPKTWI